MKPRILLVEDEVDLGNVVKQYIELSEFTIDLVHNGHLALEHLQDDYRQYELAVIDVSLPGMDGFELASLITRHGWQIPFVFLTARTEKKDRLLGLRIGADDYICKPFDIDELILRMRNIIRRRHAQKEERPFIGRGDVRFYKDALKLHIGNEDEVLLTPKESELLDYLFHNENRVLKREEILTRLWGENDYFLGRSLDVFISRLRKYLHKSSDISIDNVYGVGFVFNTPSSS